MKNKWPAIVAILMLVVLLGVNTLNLLSPNYHAFQTESIDGALELALQLFQAITVR